MTNLSSLITQTIGSSSGGVNLITAPSSASIWTGTGGVTVTTTTTAAELPLEGFSSTAVKFALSASTGTAYCDFDCPTALQNFLLQLLWYSRASSAFTASITLSINSYSSSGNRTSNTSPTVVTPQVSNVVGAGINFETNFLSTSNQYLRLTLSFGAQASAWYSIAQFGIGPSNRTQGPAIGLFESTSSYVIGSSGTLPTPGTGAVYYRRTWRDADFAIIRWEYKQTAAGSNGTGTYTLPLPTGITIDSTKIGVNTGISFIKVSGDGFWYNGSTYFRAQPYYNTSTSVGVLLSNETTSPSTTWGASAGAFSGSGNTEFAFEIRVPIAEWASSALNLGPGAQEYYVSNSLTDTAAGAVNAVGGTVYGPAGSAILSINSTALSNTSSFYMTPMYPFQSNDLAVLEITNNGSQWLPVGSGNYAVANQGSSFYGVGLTFVTSTLLIVEFGNGGFRGNNATYGLAGQAWSALAGSRWRVRVCKASSPVGFGLANVDGSAGLYKAGSAPGLATGAAISAGNIGEVYTQTWASVQITTSGVNLCTISGVQNGNYLVFIESDVGFSSATRIVSPPSGWTTGTATIVWPTQTSAGEWLRALESATAVWNFVSTCRVTTAGTIIVSVASIGGNTTSSCRGRITLMRIA